MDDRQPDRGSGRPLPAKLGIKAGMRVALVGAPVGYGDLLGPLPAGVRLVDGADAGLDFVQLFVQTVAALSVAFPVWRATLAPAGMLWVSWPKRGAALPSDLDENRIRALGLENGLVDVKVCAVDATWSGLKFVYRLRDRPTSPQFPRL